MASSTFERPTNRDGTAGWQQFVGKRIQVFTSEGSGTASRADDLVRRADAVSETLEQMLEPHGTQVDEHLAIYLTESNREETRSAMPLPEGVDPDPLLDQRAGRALVLSVNDDIATSLVDPLVRALVRRWYGADVLSAEMIIAGIAGVVAERSGNAKAVTDADGMVRRALEAGNLVSIFPLTEEPIGPEREAIAISFVAYLIEVFGSSSIGQFLAAFDPHRSDAAALSVFFQPLGALEEAWIAEIRHQAPVGTAFRAMLRQVLPLFKPHWLRGVEFVLLTIGCVALTIAAPLTIMWIVDHILPHAHGHYDDLVFFVGLLLVIFLVNAAANARRTYVEHWLNEKAMMVLHHRLFEHLQRLSHNYYSRTSTSRIMATLTEDLREIRSAVGMVAGTALYQALLALGTAITVLLLDPLLGLMVLLIVPIFAVGYVMLRSRWQREAHGFHRLQGEADQIAYENFSAHGEIKAFGLQQQTVHAYHERHQKMFGRHLRLVNLSAWFESTLHVASGVGYVIVFGFGGYQYIAGEGVTLGTLFAFAHLLPLFYEPIERLADLGHTVEGAASAFDRIDDVLKEPVQVRDKPGAPDLQPLSNEIRLEHVTFGYGTGRPVLNDLSLTIPAGSDIAIVGPSGCGKSTVVNMLMRFWDPEQGQVLFDGQDLRDVSMTSLRNQIGIVFPETFIFNTSVRENIAVGYPEATDAEIERAAQAAQLDDFIKSLPAGYNTVLGERGVRMSSGQRQRLAIARALLRDPGVLILDEATSALDPQTESEILETLATVGHGRTTISIRHRLAAVATSDIIFVLDEGQLVEQGHHADLVKAGGLYQHLYEEQMLYLHGGGVVRVGVDVERLRLVPLFAHLPPEALEAIAERFMLERFAAGQVVVRQGDPGDKLYLVSRGQLDVVKEDGATEQHLSTLGRGNFFGEMALLTNEPRNATIRTITPTQFYSLAAEDFRALLERLPDVREAVSRTAEGRRAAREHATFATGAQPTGLDVE
jgi:ATP-binding cassette subfamily B protein